MNRKVFFTALCALAFSPAMAQTSMEEEVEYGEDKYRVETNSFWSNWFISAGAGGQIYFGDHDKQLSFGDRLAPALDIAVGKWFSPEIGVRLAYSGLRMRGATKWDGDPNYDVAHGTGDPVGNGGHPHYLQKQKFNFFNFHADAMFNLSNLLCGYNEKRVYNCSPYVGLGIMSATSEPKNANISAHFGIMNSFRLCSALDLNLDLRGSLVNDEFDGEVGGRSGEGLLTATVGLTYKFKPRGWNRGKTITRTVFNNDEINAMRERLNAMSAENDRLQNALSQKDSEAARRIVERIAAANLVVFPIGESTLSNEARANLGILAEVIKESGSSQVYTITGYADAGTGSKELNERLSKARAEAVYDCLIKEFGVNKSLLRIDYKGGVENMFYDDPRLSRAVIFRGE